ncbi:MAG: hypothetical protein ACD_16C00082G0010 [uncultured bacterium]|nr:MAG: hypothetical protein ACD_16C00082G0010 [uncultured bacterium]OFW69396.1 MAG: hypothetical protein A2X70_00390 [Alphaproteobacteria bacterium GWC2_42_16]OFW74155.1 MAG: hypothetical protein A2Z80_01440 [Alphaproteobacteria bacterium GWA2_41_27]OFW84150.1 MAG: hypothetical protein A3E50_00570 [Alphaproteobacteria bacterium RIFCSPHIGHO2_12_FULL_42_100]OFW84757.1 MAG: hypothetical protein A2W06_01525 [Alphaproteobacteria bacterium RBG_16_42_14]OFW90885.1 MAG: hypothetical protein A2W46_070
MTQSFRLPLVALLSGCCLLQACGSVKKTLGIDRDPPDEFAVTPSEQPLDMPPDFFTLPTPDPGAPRPQDVKALEEKRSQVLGVKPQKGSGSEGEKNILQMAGAEKSQKEDKDIRHAVDDESRIEQAKGNTTILQTLGIKKKQPAGEVINPYEETVKLEEEGISQSSNVVQ